VSSLDRILPFLRPIEDLLVDPSITEVMVNGGGRRVFVERHGLLEAVPDRTLEVRNLTVAIKNIARACGDEISDHQPMLDARLEDGSRVAAMFPPCSVDGPTLTVRKFTHRHALWGPRRTAPACGRRPKEHPHLRRDRYRQDDTAQRARREDS
jgi:pilus assembly protein CpaF